MNRPFQKKIKYKGKAYNSVYEACKKLKFPYYLALSRLAKGESVVNAFFKGKLPPKTNEIIVGKKKYRNLEETRRELNPKESGRSVQWRFRQGWPIREVLGLKKHEGKDKTKIKFRGKVYESYSALAKTYGMSVDLFIRRIKSPKYKHKFTIAQALGLAKFKGKGFTKPLTVKGKKFSTMSTAAKHYGYSPTTVNAKLLKGWSPEQALGLKKRRGFHPESAGIVYIIQNKINKKIYIGASLGGLVNRWKWHTEKSVLKKKKKGSIAEAIYKFGKNNFTKRILKRLKNISDLSKFERRYIKKFNSMSPIGYNLSTGGIGYGNLGRKVKIQGKKFKTIKDAARYFDINPGTFITRLRSGWTLEQAAGLKKYNKIPVNNRQVKIDGRKFNSIRDAAKYYGLKDNTVRNRIAKGWSVKKALKTKKVQLAKKIKIKGKIFSSIRQVAKYYKVSSGTLARKLSRGIPIKKALGLK